MGKAIQTILNLRDNMSGGLLRISRNVDGVTASMRRSTAHIQVLGKRAGAMVGNAVQTVGRVGLAAGGAFAAFSAKAGMDFEAQMSKVGAISGAQGDQLRALASTAKTAGLAIGFAPAEAAKGLEYMSLAGWTAQQQMENLPTILQLTKATGEDMALAADLATDSLSALGLSAQDLPGYLDMVATANNRSNQNAIQLMEAYIKAGGVMAGLRIPVAESATALGVMANRGLKGAEAGTALNAILTNLTTGVGQAGKMMDKLGLSAFDTEGNFIGLEETLQRLSNATRDMTEEERNAALAAIGGKHHVDALNKLLNGLNATTASGAREWTALSEEIQNADGALAQMAQATTNNVAGALARLQATGANVGTTFYDQFSGPAADAINRLSDKLIDLEQKGTLMRWALRTADAVRFVVDRGSEAVAWLSDNRDTVLRTVKLIVGAFLACKGIKLTLDVFKVLHDLKNFGTVAFLVGRKYLPVLGKGIGTVFGLLKANPRFLAIAAIAAGCVLLIQHWDEISAAVKRVWDKIAGFFSWLGGGLAMAGQWLADTRNGICDRIADVRARMAEWLSWCGERFFTVCGEIRDAFVNAFASAREHIGGFFSWLDEKISSIPVIGNVYGGVKQAVTWAGDKLRGANALGTHYWGGGLTRMNEFGGEIVHLPSGAQVIPHDVSLAFARQAAQTAAAPVRLAKAAAPVPASGPQISVQVTIQGNVVGNEEFADEVGEHVVRKILTAVKKV